MALWEDICRNNHPKISSVSGQVMKGRCYGMAATCGHTFFTCSVSSNSLKGWTIVHPRIDWAAHVQSQVPECFQGPLGQAKGQTTIRITHAPYCPLLIYGPDSRLNLFILWQQHTTSFYHCGESSNPSLSAGQTHFLAIKYYHIQVRLKL